jgi:hypothetical protein
LQESPIRSVTASLQDCKSGAGTATGGAGGNPGGPGRPKGSKNRLQADLAQLIIQASANTGFIVMKDGQPTQGERGTLGFLEWSALHETKTFLGLLARVLPYHVLDERPEKHVLTREEAIENAGCLETLRRAPRPLDPGEDPDPYGRSSD